MEKHVEQKLAKIVSLLCCYFYFLLDQQIFFVLFFVSCHKILEFPHQSVEFLLAGSPFRACAA